jgi:Domain of unknown function (DUF4129)
LCPSSRLRRVVRTIDRAIAGVVVVAAVLGLTAPATPAPVTVPSTPVFVHGETGRRLPQPDPPPDQAREKAKQILSADEYQPPPKGLLERIVEWILEHLGSFGGSLGGGSSVFAWVILAVLIGTAVFLLSRLRGTGGRRGRHDDGVEIEVEVRRTVNEWGREAERLEAAGQWKEALRARYRELIGRLIDKEFVRDIPGRTTGEYRIEVSRNAPQVSAEFSDASELFDRAWYGDRPTGVEENARFRELAALVVTARSPEFSEAGV